MRPSSQKGGTIIAEDVTNRAMHDYEIEDFGGELTPELRAKDEQLRAEIARKQGG